MSIDYELVCHKHKEKVSLCSDGLSGPLLQCDRSLSAFSITHKYCDLSVIDESDENCDNYAIWNKVNWKEKLKYTLP